MEGSEAKSENISVRLHSSHLTQIRSFLCVRYQRFRRLLLLFFPLIVNLFERFSDYHLYLIIAERNFVRLIHAIFIQ